MERNVTLEEISDGKLYKSNDMVKTDCHDCDGCFACCQGMGDSILLDPLDIYRLTQGLSVTFEKLLEDKISLRVVDGMVVPNLNMTGEKESCIFLNNQGRCSIHAIRPGICRLFPLGRYYKDDSFWYFLQVHECKKSNKTKIKVSKWMDTKDLRKYEEYITAWHYFIKDIQNEIRCTPNGGFMKEMSMYILSHFYLESFREDIDFYIQFQERLEDARKVFNRSRWEKE